MKVWKFPLKVGSVTTVLLPEGATPVHAGDDGSGTICLWALVPSDEQTEARAFAFLATGEESPPGTLSHVGSFSLVGAMNTPNGVFIGHVFEVLA